MEWCMEPFVETLNDMNTDLIVRLREFIENEARSCSMDFGCITPLYIYRMLGGVFALEEIEEALKILDARFMIQR